MAEIIDVCLIDGQPLVEKFDPSGAPYTFFECMAPQRHYYTAVYCDGTYQPTDEEFTDRLIRRAKELETAQTVAEKDLILARMRLDTAIDGLQGVVSASLSDDCDPPGSGNDEGYTCTGYCFAVDTLKALGVEVPE